MLPENARDLGARVTREQPTYDVAFGEADMCVARPQKPYENRANWSELLLWSNATMFSSVWALRYKAIGGCGERPIYSEDMVRVVRSSMLSMRVSPEIKLASDNVLQRLGLNITEAMEMFLRRMVIDQRIPFEVVAIDPATYTKLLSDWQEASQTATKHRRKGASAGARTRTPAKRE